MNKNHLLLLFDRPQEPVFVAKGDRKAVFSVPQNFLNDKYKQIGVELTNRFGAEANEIVNVKQTQLPDISDALTIDRQECFSMFIPKHRKIAGRLIQIFLDAKSLDDLLSLACYVRDKVNPILFNYCYSVALMHRDDTQNLDLPSLVYCFPGKYFDSKVFSRAREDSSIVPQGSRIPIEIPIDYTASDLDEEHRVAYWREDIGINLHHWHWHLVYPFEGPRRLVAKNRRGELFYYMHQQINARYNFERFCNQLMRVKRLINWREPIEEGYFPKLDSLVSSRNWPPRFPNQAMQDLNREADRIRIDIDQMERWRDRIYEAIHQGFVTTEAGQRIDLTENEGVDILGNMIESTILSPNRTYYGDMHNMGHVIIGFCHDPDHRYLEQPAVMGDPAVDLRDPVFYRWHGYIDDMFQEHKATLPRYNMANLGYRGVTVTNLEVRSNQGGANNTFHTFWQQSDIDLSRGLDFQPRGNVFVRFTHLQHDPFTYNITVNNEGPRRLGTCRLFMSPKFDEKGNPWLFGDQRLMFIELDRFTVTMKQGQNRISRASTQSALTVPFERTFRNLETNRPAAGDVDRLDAYNFCGCGWPQHLLIPKGTSEGILCELFVMISNYESDRVEQEPGGECSAGDIFCGIKDRLYPDRRSMGFPFDRVARDNVQTLRQFLTPNMRVQDVRIKFDSRIVKPKNQPRGYES